MHCLLSVLYQSVTCLSTHSQAVVRVLLEAGANRNRTDKFGISALAEAVKGGHESIIDLLLSHKAE